MTWTFISARGEVGGGGGWGDTKSKNIYSGKFCKGVHFKMKPCNGQAREVVSCQLILAGTF